MPITEDDIYTVFKEKNQTPAYTINGSSIMKSGSDKIIENREFTGGRRFTISSQGKTFSLSGSEIASIINEILELNITDHKNVKNNASWNTLYGLAKRDMPFIEARTGDSVTTKKLYTYPCHYCGIILPRHLIEVDHQMPQADPAYAILKVFHSFVIDGTRGLTRERAHGAKNKQLHAILASNGIRVDVDPTDPLEIVPVKGRHFGRGWDDKDSSRRRKRRYTLNESGKIVLSMMLYRWSEQSVGQLCLNSLLNLAPSCRSCNGGKSDGVHVE